MKRLPTKEEFLELKKKCNWIWTTFNNVKGYKVTGPNGNSIFLPAAVSRYDNEAFYFNVNFGYYWSSELNTSRLSYTTAHYLGFSSNFRNLGLINPEYSLSVRLVSDTEGIDLGLSVKWLDKNEGASKPEEYGNYYTFDEAKKVFN